MAIQKGEKMVLQKLENFTNKDIIKEEAGRSAPPTIEITSRRHLGERSR